MSRSAARRRTPSELIWGWGTNGDRHAGLLERVASIEREVHRQSRLLFIVLAAVVIDTITNSGGHLLNSLRDAIQILGSIVP